MRLFLDNPFGGFPLDGGVFRVLILDSVLRPQVYLVAHKNLEGIGHQVLQLRKPLSYVVYTFLLAFMKLAGSTTENTIKNTSQ